jgi:hypothetical protein
MKALAVVLILALAGCATTPKVTSNGKEYPVAPQGVAQHDFNDCIDQTGSATPAAGAVVAGVVGGVVGAVVGGLLCGSKCARDLALLMGGTWAVRGGVEGAQVQSQEQQAMMACLAGKGYR